MDKIPGLELNEHGHHVGRDPREMTQGELRAMGHEPMSAQAALRARCVDCCAGVLPEVRLCVSVTCPSWPFRMGSSPWRAPPSDAQREASRRNAARMHAARGDAVSATRSDAADPSDVPAATPEPSVA